MSETLPVTRQPDDDVGEAPVLDQAVLDAFVQRGAIPLRHLAGAFRRRLDERSWTRTDAIAEADGLWYACPKCFITNRGLRGTHYVLCWQPHVALDVSPGPGRWNIVGTNIDDVELVAGSSSVLLTSGCAWHGFVRAGCATL